MVSLSEGSTPLVHARRLSEEVGAEVWLKLEGANPTGSFKDRGMTCAVSAAVREGAQAVICASTGNTAASLAAYAARAGIGGAVIVPEGKIATGKLAQALMHGARVIALRGNFDEALALVRELVQRHPIALVNSVNEFRIEGQKTAAFELIEELGELDALCIPVGNAGNITAYWRGFRSSAPRRGCTASRPRAPRRWCAGEPVAKPETVASAIRIGNPARWEEAMAAMTESRGRIAAVSDDEILAAYRLLAASEGVFCEPASAASVAGLLKHGAGDARRVACVLTGHGLKDPETALEQAGAVVPCEPDLAAVERAVLGRVARWSAAASSASPPRRRTSGPGSTRSPPTLGLHMELEVVETGRVRRRDRPRDRARPPQPRACAPSSACTRRTRSRSGSGPTSRCPAGWARAPRPTWRG